MIRVSDLTLDTAINIHGIDLRFVDEGNLGHFKLLAGKERVLPHIAKAEAFWLCREDNPDQKDRYSFNEIKLAVLRQQITMNTILHAVGSMWRFASELDLDLFCILALEEPGVADKEKLLLRLHGFEMTRQVEFGEIRESFLDHLYWEGSR